MDPPRGACLLGDKITPSGQETHPDRCTECTCANSTVVCKRETCPPLDCPVEQQTFASHNQCCPQCPRAVDKSDTCKDNGKMYMVRPRVLMTIMKSVVIQLDNSFFFLEW